MARSTLDPTALAPINAKRAAELGTWQDRIMAQAQRACTPLVFAQAQGDDMPIPFEVTRNGERKVVIHFFRRTDVSRHAGDVVVGHALKKVFGKPSPTMRRADGQLADCFYRDEEDIRQQAGLARKMLPSDSWYVEFPPDMSAVLPESDSLRNSLASAIKHFWEIHGNTTG